MLHCLNTSGNHLQTTTTTCSSDMTVLERQRSRMKWQHEQEEEHHQDYFCGNALGEVVEVAHKMKPDPGGFERELVSLSPMCGKKENTSRGKRKTTDTNNNNNSNKDRSSKRNKVSVEEDGESKITEQTCSKGSSEAQVQKPAADYIHVRARRGQATDSHSLAERVRREKISERMKYLQDLVPGCNKIAGKAGMLDEIINYVQSLQRQVEFLSMKLATVNTRLDFNIDELFTKEVFPQSFPTIGMPSDMTNNHAYLQFNSAQLVSCYGGLVNNIAAPVSFPETLLDTSFFNNILPSSNWEGDFQNLHNNVNFDQGRLTTSFPTQPFTGLVEASNLKMEM